MLLSYYDSRLNIPYMPIDVICIVCRQGPAEWALLGTYICFWKQTLKGDGWNEQGI
jgi:hypothetical protein